VMNLPDKEKPKDTVVNFDTKVDEAKKKYVQAKNLAEDGNKLEGEKGVPKLADSYKLLCEAHNIIQGVRDDLKKMESDKSIVVKEGVKTGDEKKATSTGYRFDEDDQMINQLKVIVRKALAERPGGMEAIKQYVDADQKAAAASGDNDPDGLLK